MSKPTSNKRYLVTAEDPRSSIAEAYRSLRTNIDFSSVDENVQVILVTSVGAGEGKSTTIGNLAVAYAQSERRVVLIDADLRKPTVHYSFDVSNQIGMSSVLAQRNQLEQAIQPTYIPNLSVIPSGPIPPNPAEMMASKKMTAVLEDLRSQFDIILIDSPPLLAVADAQILSTKCDGTILVVDQGKVKIENAQKGKASLDKVNAKILGVVLNNIKRRKNDNYYYYYGGSQ